MVMIVPVVFAVNNSYVKQLATVIASILKCGNESIIYKIYVLHTDITVENRQRLTMYMNAFPNGSIEFIDMCNFVEKVNLESFMSRREGYTYISSETYFRFYIPEIFRNYDKVIYLDADIIVLNDLTLLYETDIEDYYCAAVRDYFVTRYAKNIKKHTGQYPHLTFERYLNEILKINDNKYFNAGVLLLNLKKMREDDIQAKLWKFTVENSPLEFQDQDVLNSVFHSKVKFVNWLWNCLKSPIYPDTPYIVHFVGPEKPWCYDPSFSYNYSYIDEWWKFYELTPYFDVKDLEIKKQIRSQRRRHMLQQLMPKVFSLKNIGEHKVLTLLGMCFKLKRLE